MSSPHAYTSCELLARGIHYEVGSIEDRFARLALERERRASYTQTIVLVNAIMAVGNGIASAVRGTPNESGDDKLKKSLDALREMLLPEDAQRAERRASKARETLDKEISRGPIKVRPMASRKGRNKRRLSQ